MLERGSCSFKTRLDYLTGLALRLSQVPSGDCTALCKGKHCPEESRLGCYPGVPAVAYFLVGGHSLLDLRR